MNKKEDISAELFISIFLRWSVWLVCCELAFASFLLWTHAPTAPLFLQYGILALILIPSLRVFLTFFIFIAQRNWPFVFLTALVLITLSTGFWLKGWR